MSKKKLKVCLVDDSPIDREIEREALLGNEDFDIEVTVCRSGAEGLDKISADTFDLIVVDYKMPGMTGLEMVKKLKENNVDIPVIMATGEGDEKIAAEVMKIGAYDYVVKDDVPKGSLSLALKRTVENYGNKKERERLEAQTRAYAEKLQVANKQLMKLNQIKSDFISTVSHELRTPLTTIRETVSQVLDGILGGTTKEQQEFLTMCLEDIDRLKRIIDNLLDISKIEAGKVEIKKAPLDIVALARSVGSTFGPLAQKKSLEIKTNLPAEKIEISADKDKITQVFANLLNNALKFTQKGHVEIAVRDEGETVECSVADTGPGIAPEDLPKLFDKFEQFGRMAGPGEKGTGLGLSIAKGIVQLHKGKIRAESKLDQGTKFIFTLPKS
ncbi:MAG: hybrid sensor histidine kinase/response regulator [Candidatus Omnitrophica bacterium]|nr:hybrid sensor histidine kinase/response regulator [Candidatus Omnitrophota bacterium]